MIEGYKGDSEGICSFFCYDTRTSSSQTERSDGGTSEIPPVEGSTRATSHRRAVCICIIGSTRYFTTPLTVNSYGYRIILALSSVCVRSRRKTRNVRYSPSFISRHVAFGFAWIFDLYLRSSIGHCGFKEACRFENERFVEFTDCTEKFDGRCCMILLSLLSLSY